ncbi:hypothetical protein Dvina_14025 [Dactylosporangium vinaceum]|uniref:Peptidase MA superfamily protein n=1 Tax=Dactylosporangium vinaceum TaxID=53362 RepID=A0ABV5MHL2_9ACTN|nr:hypothetical protein [Dactylosporangium vinaceum]UAB99088.1 hypothetical protein Dvina_14025 [Dactylosporangium vinaceum]
MDDGDKTEPAAPAAVTEAGPAIPRQRGPELFVEPPPSGPDRESLLERRPDLFVPGQPPTPAAESVFAAPAGSASAPPAPSAESVSAPPAPGAESAFAPPAPATGVPAAEPGLESSPAPTEPSTEPFDGRGPAMFAPAQGLPPVSAPPGLPAPGVAPIYWPAGVVPAVAAPPARRRWPVVSGVLVAVVLVLALVVWIASQGPSGQRVALPAKAIPGRSGAVAAAAPPSNAEPTVGDKILATLTKQSKALLAGDQAGYLAGVGAGLQDGYNRRFGSLRAMGVRVWTPTLVDKPTQNADGTWSVLVRHDYCFGQGCVQQFPQVVQTSWTVAGDQATVAKYEQSSEPWDASALQTVVGRRVIVAGSGANASKLQRVATKADAAADVADRYSKWGPPPKWYIVYVAGEGEWKTWWDNGDIGASYDGYSTGPRGIVMQAADAGQTFLQVLLTHEFGHVVTVGEDYGTAEDWWMTEGIADYIADRDGTTTKGRLPDVRKFVKNGWDGKITMGPPPQNTPGWEIDARYGIALLAMTCLAKKYTEPKMLDFFGDVVRKNDSLEIASSTVLGTDWAGVETSCAQQVRSS